MEQTDTTLQAKRLHQISQINLLDNQQVMTNLANKSNLKQSRYMSNQNQTQQRNGQFQNLSVEQKKMNQKKMVRQLSPKRLIIRSGSYKMKNEKLLSMQPDNEVPTITFNNNFNKLQQQTNKTYIRPRTMLDIKNQMSQQTIRHKLPLAILDYIVKNAKQKDTQTNRLVKRSKTGKMLGKWGLSKKLNEMYNTQKCDICQIQHPLKQFDGMTKNCIHKFCSSCLHQYVIYKIQSFEAVECPDQACRQLLDQQSKFYEQLPLSVRKKHKKLMQYEMLRLHPYRKMCPKQNCEGWIQISEQIDPVCNICARKYCPKCLLQMHQGDCDNKQLSFFQDTLHYRQCSKCLNVIQKSSGCIHMTCRCGYQFCYLCGSKWKHSHTCSQGSPMPHQPLDCIICLCDCQQCIQNFQECCCDDYCEFMCDDDSLCKRFCQLIWCDVVCGPCNYCFDNGCCDDDFFQNRRCQTCPVLNTLCVGLFKVLFTTLWFTIVMPFFTMFLICMATFWLLATFVTGITLYTCQIISQLQNFNFYLAIMLYPITMFWGIWLAFKQLFVQGFFSQIREMTSDILELLTHVVCQSNQ